MRGGVRFMLRALHVSCVLYVWRAAAGADVRQPRPACARAHAMQCEKQRQDSQSSLFSVNGLNIMYKYIDGIYFGLHCPPNFALDEPALPSFEPALHVPEIELADCWPRAGSYAAALSALNVTALTPPTYLLQLYFNGAKNFNASVLTAVPNLRNLSIINNQVTAADLALLPAGLETLELKYTGIRVVPAATLARLPRLAVLDVMDQSNPVRVDAAAARQLTSLSISSLTAEVSLSLPNSLQWFKIEGWESRRPRPWLSCADLDSLVVQGGSTEALPDGWLTRCSRLRVLYVEYCKSLRSVSAGALRGAGALEEVRLTWGALEAVPAGLLDGAPALRELVLSYNHLHTLPGELFRRTTELSWLDLRSNNLSSTALEALGAAAGLRELRLDTNPALDACPAPHTTLGSSPLRNLKGLRSMWLDSTDTRLVCADWRRLQQLRRLHLARTPITHLTYADLQFNTTGDITVDLTWSDLTQILLSREDYERAAAMPAGPELVLQLPNMLRCDCQLYWAAAALRLPHPRLREEGARCQDGRALGDVPLEDLMCPVLDDCPADCACTRREDLAMRGPLLVLTCTDAELTRVPRLDTQATLQYTGPEPVSLELHLADNRINRLGPEDLPTELLTLDLRNNWLDLIDTQTAAALVSRADRRVLLAGNRLECGCRAAAALVTMRANTDVFHDWANATCSDGTPLALAAPEPCEDESAARSKQETESSEGLPSGAVAGLVASSAAAVALGLALMWRSLRRRLRGTPPARSPAILQVERRHPEPNEWSYDAFVSFAHADEAVVRELVERLEGGAAPLRLCVHYRDWVPGGWIPAQIAASVRVSRRTVAVVSEAFLRSKWARAEFREAYAAALEDTEPRLVLVLLEDPAHMPLDSELRAFVSGNTYVRWGDPWFWQKLQDALPAADMLLPVEEPAPAPDGSQ